MRTNTRVEFGLYDVTAKGDSNLSSADMKDFCNLKRDLQLESAPSQQKYGTLETGQWLMDGSFSFFPEIPDQYFWGFWSSEISNSNGVFATPPTLEISFSQPHSSSGLTLHFYSPTNDWASQVKIQWFDDIGGTIASGIFDPDCVDYYCAKKVENYSKIKIQFLGTNKPGRYIKLAGIDYGVYLHFEGEEIVEAHVLEECDPLSSEISINTLNLSLYNAARRFSILNPEGYFDVLQHKQKLTIWEDVKQSSTDTGSVSYCMGTFYLSDWENTSDTVADFTATDAVGLLDGASYDGGMYDTTCGAVISDILDGYEYSLDASLTNAPIKGYIAPGTRREALQQVAFAIGAIVDCSRGALIKIAPAPSKASGMIQYDRKFLDDSKVTLKPLITSVAVIAHSYTAEDDESELYKDTLAPGDYRVAFSDPAVEDSLTVTGASIVSSGVNYCSLHVERTGEVLVKGQKYVDSSITMRRVATDLPANAQDNELTVKDATLVDTTKAAEVADRILAYYSQRYEQAFSMVAGDEKLADQLIIQSFGGEMVRGVLTKMEFDLTGGYIADVTVVGRRLSSDAAAYAGTEIHAGERSMI